MELALYNDLDSGNEFWHSKDVLSHEICAKALIKELEIDLQTPVIYIMTAPEAPVGESENVFDIYDTPNVIREGEMLDFDVRNWLRDAWKEGDRVAWIEYDD